MLCTQGIDPVPRVLPRLGAKPVTLIRNTLLTLTPSGATSIPTVLLVSKAGPADMEKPATFLTHKLKQNQCNARKLDKSPGLLQAQHKLQGNLFVGRELVSARRKRR
jgi:hypothetical protein